MPLLQGGQGFQEQDHPLAGPLVSPASSMRFPPNCCFPKGQQRQPARGSASQGTRRTPRCGRDPPRRAQPLLRPVLSPPWLQTQLGRALHLSPVSDAKSPPLCVRRSPAGRIGPPRRRCCGCGSRSSGAAQPGSRPAPFWFLLDSSLLCGEEVHAPQRSSLGAPEPCSCRAAGRGVSVVPSGRPTSHSPAGGNGLAAPG